MSDHVLRACVTRSIDRSIDQSIDEESHKNNDDANMRGQVLGESQTHVNKRQGQNSKTKMRHHLNDAGGGGEEFSTAPITNNT